MWGVVFGSVATACFALLPFGGPQILIMPELSPGQLLILDSQGRLSKFAVPFWVPIIIRHLLFRVHKKGP